MAKRPDNVCAVCDTGEKENLFNRIAICPQLTSLRKKYFKTGIFEAIDVENHSTTIKFVENALVYKWSELKLI